MKNERQIKPLRQYEVFRNVWNGGDNQVVSETFTADDYEVINDCRVRFMSSGNTVREYFGMPEKVIITPVDEQVPE